MKDHLVIQEKYFEYWPGVVIGSLILSVILFVAYHFINDVLWVGYLRLGSFIFFAVALLSCFKVYDGQVEITVRIEDDSLKSEYRVREKTIFSNEHHHTDFHKLEVNQLPNKSIYNDFVKSDKCVRFQKKDDNTWYYFNEIESRVIPLSEEKANRLRDFLERHSKG